MEIQVESLVIGAIVLATCVILLVLLGVSYFGQRKRRDAFAVLGDAMGCSFSPRGDPAFLERVQHLGFFARGRGYGRRVRNLIRGESAGAGVAVFDFVYRPLYRRGVVRRTAVLIESQDLDLAGFTLSPAGLFDGLRRDVDLDAYPYFSRRYLLQSRGGEGEEDAVRAVFGPDVVGFFEERGGVAVEALGHHLLYYGASRPVSTDRLANLVDEALDLYLMFRRAR
jgi:hypothetical protein